MIATAAMLGTAAGSPASAALRVRGNTELYNLEQARAAATFREAIAADPNDAAAYRGLAGTLWISIAFDRGTMTVDSYMGRVTRDKVVLPPPPAAVAAEFNRSIETALALSRARLSAHPDDPDADFELGARNRPAGVRTPRPSTAGWSAPFALPRKPTMPTSASWRFVLSGATPG